MIDSIEINDRIAKCERILEANPQSQIFAALADAYRKKGDIQRALEICADGLDIHPDYPSARVVMAKICLAKENYEAASEELKKAISLAGRTRIIDFLEAEIHIRLGRKAEAGAILSSLAASDPSDENVKELMALLEKAEHETTSNLAIPPPVKAVSPRNEVQFIPQLKSEHREKKEMSLSLAISILKTMPRVLGVIAVDHDGMILEARFDSLRTKDEFAAFSKEIFDSARACLEKIALGVCSEVLIETASHKLWIFSKEKYLLLVYSRDDASMGALRLRIDDLFECVELMGSEANRS
jgi:predicted regulator of Ras-like GTPase activity (Roadblock/LC7/MglB family)